MLHNVSLNASMRANLLSLQQTSKLQDITSNRLSTGLKVNSAIDNPSAYYTAQSLSDRASDLNALLDAMSQGIQTLKAVAETIDAATGFLQQAKAVASQASETAASLPEKSWFEEQVGPDGAVVETTDELKAAVAAGKETIVIYGSIDLGEITTTGLTLKDNQKLVGVNYFGSFAKDFSEIRASSNAATVLIRISGKNCELSDLSVSLSTTDMIGLRGIYAAQNCTLRNLEINMHNGDNSENGYYNFTAISTLADIRFEGNNEINFTGYSNRNMALYSGVHFSKVEFLVSCGANLEINSSSIAAYCAHLTLEDEANVYIDSKSHAGYIANIELKGASSRLTVERGNFLAAGTYEGESCGYISMVAGAEVVLATGKAYRANENFMAFLVKTSHTSDVTDEFLSHVSETAASEYVPPQNTYPDVTEMLSAGCRYNGLLDEYDRLVSDGRYQGINLLQNDSLRVIFNDDRSSLLDVRGTDASASALGLSKGEWKTANDVARSLTEISSALTRLRDIAAQFGTCNAVLTVRQNFTEAMINILEEGADKLTLADMNQESANMLALQTRQMLAANALSLASWTAKAVLRLF